MRIKTYNSLGLKVPVSVFSSADEYNSAAKRPNEDAVVEDANDNLVYRGPLADFREEFCQEVEQATGIGRNKEPVLDKAGKQKVDDETKEPLWEWTENESAYFRRVIAQTGRSVESFQEIADAVASTHENEDGTSGYVADPTVKEKKPAGPKTPSKTTYAVVDELIATGKATHTAADLAKLLGRHVDHDREALARAIHEYQLGEIKKIKAKFTLPTAPATA